jgi:hypothetical protein
VKKPLQTAKIWVGANFGCLHKESGKKSKYINEADFGGFVEFCVQDSAF